MSRMRVYDLPLRSFHWCFAVGLVLVLGIALTASHRGGVFPYHKLIALVVTAAVLLRIVWGFVGSRYERFNAFILKPADLLGYFKGVFTGGGRLYAGHNPASAYAALAMFLLVFAVVTCGLLVSFGYRAAGDVHVVLAWVLVGVIASHVLGVVIHIIQHHDNIAASMVTGYKRREAGEPIASNHPIVAGVFIGLIALWAGGLIHNYNPDTGRVRLPLIGTSIRVGMGDESHEYAPPPDPQSHHAEHPHA